jgi:hypothetical protein
LEVLATFKTFRLLPYSGGPAQAGPQATADHDGEEASSGQAEAPPSEPAPDRRKVQFVKGKLLKVDCRQPPIAILTVRTNSRILRLRTDDYKSLLLVGADDFSCEWTDRSVVANYKAGGKADGDLVSVEVQ